MNEQEQDDGAPRGDEVPYLGWQEELAADEGYTQWLAQVQS